MSDSPVVTVCLSQATPRDQIAAAAASLLDVHGITDTSPAWHFRAGTRLRTGQLLHPRNGATAGGPIRLLDLTGMRSDWFRRYGNRWQLWHQIVAGSPPARSWWHFHDRHLAQPEAYSFDHARHGFASQPRIARMLTYNSHPGRVTDLPLHHLDAFEAGPQAYATYGWLQAVPGDSMLTVDGQLLRPVTRRYTDQLDFLRQANEHLAGLEAADLLAAVTTA